MCICTCMWQLLSCHGQVDLTSCDSPTDNLSFPDPHAIGSRAQVFHIHGAPCCADQQHDLFVVPSLRGACGARRSPIPGVLGRPNTPRHTVIGAC